MSSQIDDLTAEVSKERKLRSRSEQYSKQLEDEIDILKVNMHVASNGTFKPCLNFELLTAIPGVGLLRHVSEKCSEYRYFPLNIHPLLHIPCFFDMAKEIMLSIL